MKSFNRSTIKLNGVILFICYINLIFSFRLNQIQPRIIRHVTNRVSFKSSTTQLSYAVTSAPLPINQMKQNPQLLSDHDIMTMREADYQDIPSIALLRMEVFYPEV